MQKLQLSFLFASLLVSFPFLCNCDVVDGFGASQYIFYSGKLKSTATWNHSIVPPGVSSDCSDETIGPYDGAGLQIGLNAPWDSNPFYFTLSFTPLDCNGSSICFTEDRLFSCDFTSAAYEYFSDGEICSWFEVGVYYEPDIFLDLRGKATTIDRVPDGGGGQAGYKVVGTKDAWIGKDGSNALSVQHECLWISDDAQKSLQRYSWVDFSWNKTTPLTFTLLFTNTTATLTLTTQIYSHDLSYPVSTEILTFTGSRNDTKSSVFQNSTHDLNPIQLDTSDAKVPRFEWVNGSGIYFAETVTESQIEWVVGPSSLVMGGTGSSSSMSIAMTSVTDLSTVETGGAVTTTSGSGNGNGAGGVRGRRSVEMVVVVVLVVSVGVVGI